MTDYAVTQERARLHAQHHRTGTLNELTYAHWQQALIKWDKASMMKRTAPTAATMDSYTTLLTMYIQDGDTEAILWLMLEAERSGIAYWNGKDWTWRKAS